MKNLESVNEVHESMWQSMQSIQIKAIINLNFTKI